MWLVSGSAGLGLLGLCSVLMLEAVMVLFKICVGT